MYLIVVFIMSILSHGGLKSTIGYVINNIEKFIGIQMFIYYKTIYDYNRFKKILYSVISIWMYYCIKALFFYSKNSGAARILISTGRTKYGNVAIGEAYGIAFGSAIIAVYIFALLFQDKTIIKRKFKMLFVVIILILFYLCIKTESSITLIMFIIGIVINMALNLFNTWSKGNKLVLANLFTLSIIFVFILVINLENIGYVIYNTTYGSIRNNILVDRLNLLAKTMISGNAHGTLDSRLSLYKKSINTFIGNPIFGTALDYGLGMSSVLGNHSELLDILGSVGLFGGIPYVGIFFSTIYTERKKNKNVIAIGYVITFVLMFVFNQFHYAQSLFALLFIIPALGSVFVRYS